MKIFSAAQVREWDQFTISNKPIAAIDLMEKAATACHRWIKENLTPGKQFIFCCGNGNNGGDGLAIARMMLNEGQQVKIFMLKADKRSADCESNYEKIKALHIPITAIDTEAAFPGILKDDVIVDALFGTGLNKPLDGIAQQLVQHINDSAATIISIDMPSGLLADASSIGNTIVKATYTLSFQCSKLAFMFAENSDYFGEINLLNIGLHQQYYQNTHSSYATIDQQLVKSIYKPRKQFSHKYAYGHALLYAGGKNMMGAALLCAKACLRSGAGLVTVHTDEALMSIIQTALPEAISSAEENFDTINKKKAAIGIGPGLELSLANTKRLQQIISKWKGPLVIDAAGLSLLKSLNDALIQKQNNAAILTPHTGEFEKLFGSTANDFERAALALEKATQLNYYIILKGKNSLIACPDGEAFFNTTGNSGMATAGSGDVLTGIITGLLSQGYTARQACIMGVYLHGLAGDLAAEKFSPEAMIAGDITEQLGAAFKTLH